jgi:nicotinamidase-related amidase
VSEHYRKGLGPTIDRLSSILSADGRSASILEKLHFSCAADPDILFQITSLAENGRRQLVIAGVEAHVCVLQSALGFKQAGLDVYVAIDATSSRDKNSWAMAKDRFNAHSIGVVTLEMVVFEWLHVAGTSEFKKLSRLVK